MSMLKRVAINVVMFLSLFGGFGLTAQAYEFPVNHALYLDGYKDSGLVRMKAYVILSSDTLLEPATRYSDDKYYSYSLLWLNSKTVQLRIDITKYAGSLLPGETIIDSVDLTYTSDKSGTISNYYSIHYQNGIEIDKWGMRNGVFTLVPVPMPNYTITTSSNPANGGTTFGGGSLASGSSCTVTASANSGYRFSNWTEGWTVVSTYANYTFTVTGNRTLTANFTVIPPTLAVTPTQLNVSRDAGSRSFDIAISGAGTIAWTAAVISGGSWARLLSGANGSNSGKVTVGYDRNPDNGAPRTATIRLTASGATGSPTDVTLTQASGGTAGTYDSELSVEPGRLSLDAGSSGYSSFNVANSGSASTVWTAAVISGGTWLRIAAGSVGQNAGSVSLFFFPNPPGGAARTATVRVTAAGAAPAYVTVTQAANADAAANYRYEVAATVGVAFSLTLSESETDSGFLEGLKAWTPPPGLKYSAADRTISGVPTGGSRYQRYGQLAVSVAELPVWAQGAFSGYVEGGGLATMTVSAAGKITGKIARFGKTYTFSAVSYAGGNAEEGFVVSAVAKAGTMSLPLALTVTHAGEQGLPGVANGTLEGTASLKLWRNNLLKEQGRKLAACVGYFTATLPGGDGYGSGYLTFTVDKAGGVKTAGKLADGTALTVSGSLLLDNSGRVFLPVYTSPTAYMGGCFFGLAEFVADAGKVYLRPLDGAPFTWQSRNPQATGEYGKGFSRELGITGGWYSKTENLYGYYGGGVLEAGTDGEAEAPELIVGSAREPSDWWDPSGVVLTPVFKSDIMTGLTAPAAGKPTDPENDGTWSYGAANTVGLKIALTRPTGIFKGSFLAWFDYPEKKHVSKSLAFEGALTPVREDPSDGVGGRGFFLWPDKSLSPAYAFKWSYDFKILMTE